MAVATGTITGVTHVRSKEQLGKKAYLLTVDFPAYTGASDTFYIADVGATILAHTRNGETVTLQGAICVAPGVDTNAQNVYAAGAAVQALTVAGDALTGNLADIDGAELTSSTACKGVELLVAVKEV